MEIENLAFYKYNDYLSSIDPILSEKVLSDFQVSSYPHMNKSSRQKLFSQIKRRLSTAIESPKGAFRNAADIANNLARKLKNG